MPERPGGPPAPAIWRTTGRDARALGSGPFAATIGAVRGPSHKIATMTGERLAKATDLHRYYGAHHALRGLSLEVCRGEVLGLLGPNGAGKSTTMQILAGVLAPSRGAVEICGVDLLERAAEAKRNVGYLPENPPLYEELSVDEYLAYAAQLRGVARTAIAGAMAEAKARTGLEAVGHRLLGNLSKGYRQRVGIAQAIVHRPALVILDEPTVGLDPNQIREIRALVRELGDAHAVLLSTHLLPEVQAVCDRVQIIGDGRLLLDRRIEELDRDAAGPSLSLGLARPPGLDELAALDGVARVEALGGGRFTLHGVPGEGLDAERIAAQAVAGGWGLVELAAGHSALEEIFVALTCGETATEEPDAA